MPLPKLKSVQKSAATFKYSIPGKGLRFLERTRGPQDPKEYPITEAHREDFITEDPRDSPIIEDYLKDPNTENPKKNPINEDYKKDNITKEYPITEEPKEGPITEDPKENPSTHKNASFLVMLYKIVGGGDKLSLIFFHIKLKVYSE